LASKSCLDSYGMTNIILEKYSSSMAKLQPDLSGNPFLRVLQVLFKLKSFAKKIGSGRRIKLP